MKNRGDGSMQIRFSQRAMLILLCGYVCGFGFMENVEAATAAEVMHLERTFRGTINEKWDIQLTLRSTEPISGSYFYERIKNLIPIEARLSEDQNWVVTEFDDKRTVTGQFIGDIFGRVFSGTWSNADRSKRYPFYLVETHRQWRGDESPYRPTDQLVVQAKKGNRDAQFHLAFLYHYGQGGVQHDIGEAVAWYKKAAAQGHPRAEYTLGNLYLAAHGVRPNVETALELISKAASSGDRLAKKQFAEIDKYKTRPYLEKRQAARDAQFYVDLMETDPAEAERGLQSIDTPGAKVYLAYMYYEGLARAQNPSEKVNALLREAADSIKKDLGKVSDTIYGVGHGTIFEYMREAATDIAVPCDIFVKYPKAAFEAFGSHYGGCSDSFPYICGPNLLNEAVPAISQYIVEQRKNTGTSRDCDVGTIRCPIGRDLSRIETVWNVAPQMWLEQDQDIEVDHCLVICEEPTTKLEKLRLKSLLGLQQFFQQDFYFTKENAKKLASGYLRSREKAEDVWVELYSQCQTQ
jgi:Sel1 repeat